MINNFVILNEDDDDDDEFVLNLPTNCTRQDAPKVLARTFFVCRVINVWNSLPNTVCFNSQASFKRSLKNVNFSEFLKCY